VAYNQPLILIVAEADNRRGYFDGEIGGRLVVQRSRQPFLGAARALLAQGIDPATPLLMRYKGSGTDSLRSTVGKAAPLTVEERAYGGAPKYARWQPYPMSPTPDDDKRMGGATNVEVRPL
jgi:hypothetical protein